MEERDDQTQTAIRVRPRKRSPKVDRLPPWKVLLHNDDVNEMGFVVEAIIQLTRLNQEAAIQRMLEAHDAGITLLVVTNQEHAELLQEQFTTKTLMVTIEPD